MYLPSPDVSPRSRDVLRVCDVSKCAGIVCCINWWANHVKDFPNLARMARQYLGVPATSATVERLFSVVGFAFADRRKSQSAETLANLAFAKLNLPTSKLQ